MCTSERFQVTANRIYLDNVNPRTLLLATIGDLVANERNKLIRQFTVNRFTTVGYNATYFYPRSYPRSCSATVYLLLPHSHDRFPVVLPVLRKGGN